MNTKKITRLITIVGLMSLVLVPAMASAEVDFGTNYAANLGLSNRDPRDMAVSIIKVILSFLGIIAVCMILWGGFMWMTAAGNDEKVGTARKIIIAGIIGLAIIIAAWGITNFVINALFNATSNTGTT